MLQFVDNVTYVTGSTLERHGISCAWDDTKPPRAAFIFIHGGGWQSGDKDYYHQTIQYISSLGYPAFSINYKLGDNSYPNNVADIALAINWVKARTCVNANRINLAGVSAGGHLCLMHGFQTPVRGILNMNGPWSFDPAFQPQGLIDSFDDMRGSYSVAECSPVTYLPSQSPVWDVRGTDDFIVTDKDVTFIHLQQDKLPAKSRQIIINDDHIILDNPETTKIIEDFVEEFK